MGIEINIKHTLSDEFLMDVMVTMVETPYGPWWHFVHVSRREDLMITDFIVADAEDWHEAMDEIANCDDQDVANEISRNVERYTITPQKVAEAIERVLADDNYVGAGIQDAIARGARDNDAGDIDAIGADCLLQIACFDEVTYG